jgi:hypothetical protein
VCRTQALNKALIRQHTKTRRKEFKKLFSFPFLRAKRCLMENIFDIAAAQNKSTEN